MRALLAAAGTGMVLSLLRDRLPLSCWQGRSTRRRWVSATGFAAEKLWHKVMANFEMYVGDENLRSYYEDLGNKALTNAELVDRILRITTRLASP